MIFGDTLIITRDGIEVSSKTLETIGIYENSRVHMLPFRTFEYRKHEQGYDFPMDLLVTPIRPKAWPFVIRFVFRLYNRPGAMEGALSLLQKLGIDILFTECTRSGHHHSVLNVLGVMKRLEGRKLSRLFNELKDFGESQRAKSSDEDVQRIDPWWYIAMQEYQKYVDKRKNNEDIGDIKKGFFCLIKLFIPKKSNEIEKGSYQLTFSDIMLAKKVENPKFLEGEFDQNLGELIGKFLAYKYLDSSKTELELPLQELLNNEVERTRPIIRQFEKEYREKKMVPRDLYKLVEDEITPLKGLLRAILNFKQILCRKYEILIIRDSLFRDECLRMEELDLNEIKSYCRNEYYVYNIRYYVDQAKYRSFAEESFLDEFNNIPFKAFLDDKKNSKKYLKKIGERKLQRDPAAGQDIADDLEKEILGLEAKLGTVFKQEGLKGDIESASEALKEKAVRQWLKLPLKDEGQIHWENQVKMIIAAIEELPPGRKGATSNQSRLDLDPIIITPVEFLSHAYYHLAYNLNFKTTAGKSRIPFPKKAEPDYPADFLNLVLHPRKHSTFAITSRNTEDLTLRLCPVPNDNLDRFSNVSLTVYNRNCFKECKEKGLVRFGEEGIYDIRAAQISTGKEGVENDMGKKGQCGQEQPNQCNGTTIGLELALAKALNEVKEERTVNIWRAFNKTNFKHSNGESGSIHFLIQQMDDRKVDFDEAWRSKLKQRLLSEIRNEESALEHTKIGAVTCEKLSGGHVFVSLPIHHPMANDWLECIREEGKKMGFSSIDTVSTFTRPVTSSVAEEIKKSDAMLQVLSFPLAKANDLRAERQNSGNSLSWLHSEYLTAITNNTSVVRLVDEATIHDNNLLIGKDHATFRFSIGDPFSTFRETVQKAFEELRNDLSDKLGLS